MAATKDQGSRRFSADTEKKCWEKATIIFGRDQDRWRYDVAGNPVFKEFRGKQGLAGWECDHVKPWKNKGASDLDNCQVLQTKANRSKGGRDNVTVGQLQGMSPVIKLRAEHMDTIEMSYYGNITGEDTKIKCTCVSRDKSSGVGSVKTKNQKIECQDPFPCSREVDFCMKAELFTKMVQAMRALRIPPPILRLPK